MSTVGRVRTNERIVGRPPKGRHLTGNYFSTLSPCAIIGSS
jgi:hypothetical protein